MPLVNLANPIDSQGVQQLAGPFGPYISNGTSFPSSYDFAKRFVSTPQTTQGGKTGVTTLDDPTYLGFNIRFDILSPLFNGAIIGDSEPPESPVSPNAELAQLLGIPVASVNELINSLNNPSGPSAVGYLQRIGENTRASYLRAFIQGMRELQSNRQYYFQTIEGLGEAFGKTISMSDPFSGSSDSEGIKIGCLEAIDLKMSALFNLLKMACYDVKYKRTILPINLMYFDVYIDVLEIRKFKTVRNWLNALNLSEAEPDSLLYINNNTSQITFKFSDCVWAIEESGTVFENVTNAGHDGFAVSAMKWNYNRVEMESQFSGYNSKLTDSRPQQDSSGNFKDAAKKFQKDAVLNQAAGGINKLERGANSLAQNRTLGNVFGIRNEAFEFINNPQSLISSVNGAAIQAGQAIGGGSGNIQNRVSINDNPLGEAPQINNSLPTDNIYGEGPSGPPPLNSTNAFE